MALFVQNVYTAKETKTATVGTSAVVALAGFAFGAQNVINVKRLVITAGANPIRITWSGQDPTSTLGHYIAALGNYTLDGSINCSKLKAIGIGGDSVTTVTLEV
jgi:hypothetical protein